jgi:hypothetical protein
MVWSSALFWKRRLTGCGAVSKCLLRYASPTTQRGRETVTARAADSSAPFTVRREASSGCSARRCGPARSCCSSCIPREGARLEVRSVGRLEARRLPDHPAAARFVTPLPRRTWSQKRRRLNSSVGPAMSRRRGAGTAAPSHSPAAADQAPPASAANPTAPQGSSRRCRAPSVPTA